jgi:hypothetical protein
MPAVCADFQRQIGRDPEARCELAAGLKLSYTAAAMLLRQMIGLVLAIGMIAGGLYVMISFIMTFIYSGHLSYAGVVVFLSAGSLFAVGAAWLWSDYLKPETRADRKDND